MGLPGVIGDDAMSALRDAAMKSKAWPFEEARALLKRYEKKDPEKGYVLFETGYGPSGSAAYRHLWRGGAHDDDPPGVRGDLGHSDAADLFFRRCGRHAQGARERAAAGDAAPAHAEAADLGAGPVWRVSKALAHHNNAMLRRFLDTFGFEYEFIRATEFYKSGQFDATLRLCCGAL